MSTKIGRLTLPLRPEVYNVGTGKLTLTGVVEADTLGKADHLRRQFAEIAATGAEDVIPVIVEDGFSGYVKPTSTSVDLLPGAALRRGWFRYTIEAVPVLASGLPVVESIVSGALRVNAHSIAANSAYPFHSVPGTAEQHDWYAGNFDADEERDVDGGTVLWKAADNSVVDAYSGLATWAVVPDDWYMGACGVEILVDGEYLPVTAPGLALDDTWLLSNGMVRVGVPAGDTEVRVEWFEGSWVDPVEFEVISQQGAFGWHATIWETARIVSIAPHSTTVAVVGRERQENIGGVYEAGVITAFLTLRRGSPWVDVRLSRSTASHKIGVVGVRPATSTATDDQTWGATQDTAVNGFRWIIAAAVANDVNTTTGQVDPTSPGVLQSFGIGAVHSSWTGVRTITTAHLEWFAVQGERTLIGTRT